MAETVVSSLEDTELIGSWFSVVIGGEDCGFFTDVSGLSMDVVVVTTTDTNKRTETRKRPGFTQYNDITLTRTFSRDKFFYDWIDGIRNGTSGAYRKDGAINVYGADGTVQGQWDMLNIWPSSWSASDLTVDSDDLMKETVVLQVEQLIRKK